ncbi:glycoside hydrolase domain-containing protein [Gemmatimonadota bacterium]
MLKNKIILAALWLIFCFPGVSVSQMEYADSEVWLGDLNEDGRLNIIDAIEILILISKGGPSTERERQIANVDGSQQGEVEIGDAVALVRMILGQESPRKITFSTSIESIWAVGDGEKIFRDETDHFSKSGNNVWDGDTIRLEGLYNEVLAFQVMLVAGNNGARNVSLSIDPPRNDSTGRTIGAPDGPAYGPGGWVELFSEHYLEVVNATNPLWFYGSAAAAPERMTGWIPDALVPPEAQSGKGGFPIDIEPGMVQGFWVDLYLPRDTVNFTPGVYRGMVRISEDGWPVDSLPLEITLLNGYLPDENHANVWLYHDSVEPYYQELSSLEVEKMLKYEAHRHRADLVGGFSVHHSRFDAAAMDSYRKYLDGTAFTRAGGYEGPGQGTGEKLFPIGMYGGSVMGDNESEVRAEADKWVNWFDENAPGVRYFWYLIDEPGSDKFDWIKERAGWIHNYEGAGSRMPVFTTREYADEISGEIDIWAGGQGLPVTDLSSLHEQGKEHWFYNGFRPRWGSYILEAEAVDLRMNAWAKYIYGVSTWFAWHVTHWFHNSQGNRGNTHQNIFVDPATFYIYQATFGNGDGILFYPGREPFYPEQDRGVNRLLPSIKLKNVRRGQQDYEIMWLAEQRVAREKVLEIVKKVVPRAFSSVGRSSRVPWSQRGADYDQARKELLLLITGGM